MGVFAKSAGLNVLIGALFVVPLSAALHVVRKTGRKKRRAINSLRRKYDLTNLSCYIRCNGGDIWIKLNSDRK